MSDLVPTDPPPPGSTPGVPGAARRDYLTIISGTSQNLIGIVVAALATFGAQVLITRSLGAAPSGVVTVLTQAAFVLSFLTRAGMDMAVLRDVAVEAGAANWHLMRRPVARAVAVAAAVSTVVVVLVILAGDRIRDVFPNAQDADGAVEAAALGLPFCAAANVWLAATRGLKIMRYTLYVFWAGQPLLWILLMLVGWQVSQSVWMTILAYSASWGIAAILSWYFWRKESRPWDVAPPPEGWLQRLMRYAGPRAPAALFSQLLFWTDLFVLTHYAGDVEVGVYATTLRIGQIVVLFLTSVSLMFSPFVADLHSRGERERLDGLFKALTRWTIAATLPAVLVLAVAPSEVLQVFGGEFRGGEAALLILLAGQVANIATGSVGFVLIMVGRTGWDLVVYTGSLVMNLALALWLCPRYGMEGAAIANAATFAASKGVRLYLVKRFVDIQPYDRDYARLIAPAVVAAGVMVLVHGSVTRGWGADLAATTSLGFVAYATTYLLVGLTAAERRGLSALGRRVLTR